MNKFKALALVATMGVAASMNTSVMADGVMEYVKSGSGDVVMNPFGDCWRSPYDISSDMLEKCGDAAPAPMVVEKEIVVAPTSASVTTIIYEDIAISAALLFGFDSDALSDDAMAVIDERIAKFKGKAELTKNVSVMGHTDSTGPEAYNMGLSERRARSVATYLEAHTNISDDKIDTTGMGETDPAASNDTREGRQANRRVVIHLEGKLEK